MTHSSSSMNQLLILSIPLIPLLGFLVTGFFSQLMGKRTASFLSSAGLLVSFLASVSCLIGISRGDHYHVDLGTWISSDQWSVSLGFQLDELSVIMSMLVTGVGALIFLYSGGYMHDDERHNRFFSYLNLFVFFMLLLVMSDNYLLLFAGWEGVGLCSYLLIGFWHRVPEYNRAASKAFIMNRIGDLGFLLAAFAMLLHFGSLSFNDVLNTESLKTLDPSWVTAICLFLILAATGKSAQIPLYTWLPDAMAGPTPVSALIHAATMVTAGIYLVLRSHLLFDLSPVAQTVMQVVGLSTAILAALIATRQNDIKKVLAYSTISQLGFMFLALGLGAYVASFFHLLTHAFFKALLFLAAGSVIHGLHGEQSILNMGGVAAKMKITYRTFLVGTLAISGIPPLAGFFSKDQILVAAFAQNPLVYVLLLLASLLTVFYMFRLVLLVFHGQSRVSPEVREQIHESPPSMILPLLALSGLSVFGGVLNIPALFGGGAWLEHFLSPVMTVHEDFHGISHATEWILMGLLFVLTAGVIVYAVQVYVRQRNVPLPEEAESGLGRIFSRKFYIDELYQAGIVQPLKLLSGRVLGFVEWKLVDGAVQGIARGISMAGSLIRVIQVGTAGFYIFAFAVSMLILILIKVLL